MKVTEYRGFKIVDLRKSSYHPRFEIICPDGRHFDTPTIKKAHMSIDGIIHDLRTGNRL